MNYMNKTEELKMVEELKKLVWTLLEKINDLEAAIAAKKKGV